MSTNTRESAAPLSTSRAPAHLQCLPNVAPIRTRPARCSATRMSSHSPSEMDWSNDLVIAFLKLYRTYNVIWDPNHSEHRNKTKVLEAWLQLKQAMDTDMSVPDLKRKKDALMASYRNLQKKAQVAKEKGLTFKTSWFAYNIMNSFLQNVYKPKVFVGTDVCDDDAKDMFEHSNFEYEDFELPNDDENFVEEKPVIGKKRRFEYEEEPEQDLLNVAEQPLQESVPLEKSNHQPARKQDELSLYGQLLVTKLRKFDHQTRLVVCNKIDNLIFEMEMKSMKSKEQACQDPLLNDVPSTSRINYNKSPNSTPSHSEMSDH